MADWPSWGSSNTTIDLARSGQNTENELDTTHHKNQSHKNERTDAIFSPEKRLHVDSVVTFLTNFFPK